MKKVMAYNYRLRPTAEQRVLLGKMAGHNRFIWNKGVALNKERYEKGELRLSGFSLSNLLTGWKKEPDLAVLQEVLGHASITTTANIYGHLQAEATRTATERIGAAIAG